ncbi:MAG: terminase [Alphaproteobacteria bacterium]|nr:terminase [Alphaproteobacteria bacterium]
MPAKTTVLRWMQDDDEGLLRDQYARAREMQADHYAEEIIEISDESANDTFIDEHGNERNNNEIVARSRLRVDSRKWLAGKLRPKVYGEKIVQEHTGNLTVSLPEKARDI